jgi:hypothetical protein
MSFFNSIDENGMYDHPLKVPSPSLLLPTPEQDAQLATAREKVAAAQLAYENELNAGQQRFAAWLKAPQRSGSTNPVGYFTFDANLAKVPNEAPGRTTERSRHPWKSSAVRWRSWRLVPRFTASRTVRLFQSRFLAARH